MLMDGSHVEVAYPETGGVIDVWNAPNVTVFGDGGSGAALLAHIEDATPHPAYDDIEALDVLLENRLV